MACKREDRFRHNTIAFWLSDEEKAEVEAKIILSGVPKGEYYRKSVLEQEIKVVSGNYMSFRLSKVLERIYEELHNRKCWIRRKNCSRKCKFEESEERTMNLTYEKCGDYLIPNIIPDPEPGEELRKFGLMRKNYLKEYKSGIYQGMVLSGKLKEHLLMVQEQAELQFDVLVEQMAEREGVIEQLKEENQMLWAQKMNNIRARAEEIVREEIIYCNG